MNIDFSTEEGRAEFYEATKRIRISNEEALGTVIDQFEYTRKQINVTKQYFSTLLGIDPSYYLRMVKYKCKVPLPVLINYCRIFGMDITALTEESLLNASDSAIRETAMYLGRLSNDTLAKVEAVIADSSEDSRTKEHGKILFEKLRSIDPLPKTELADN